MTTAQAEVTKVLGVKVDALTMREVIQKTRAFLQSQTPQRILTLNSEMLYAAGQNPGLAPLLKNANLTVCDGRGVMQLAKLESNRSPHFFSNVAYLIRLITQSLLHAKFEKSVIPERIGGIDLAEAMMQDEILGQARFFLLGGEQGVAAKARARLLKKFPHLKIVGAEEGIREGENSPLQTEKLQEKIRSADAEIVLVAFGFPKQEMWIEKNMHRLPAKIYMGVGGAFDVWSGEIARAPRAWQNHGLEWLWRLIQEPHRLKRIYNATLGVSIFALKQITKQAQNET